MSTEVFRIEVPISVSDNTDPGISSATKKLTAFDKANQQLQSRLKAMTGAKYDLLVEAKDKATSIIEKIKTGVTSVAGKVWSIGISAVDKASSIVTGIASKLTKLLGIGTAVSAVLGGLTIGDMLSAASTQNTVEKQLETVLANVSDAEDAMDRLKAKASALQQTTMYGDETYLAGAAELATYLSDTDALERAMDVLSDYAAGMSGGAELSTQEMTDYATQLGKALNGSSASFDGLTKKGFAFSDAQKAILQSDLTSDLEKITVLQEVIAESWDGLAEAFADTPTAKVTSFKNAWGDVKEVIGNKLYPSVGSFFSMLTTKLPAVQSLLETGADWLNETFESLIPLISDKIDGAIEKVEKFGKTLKDMFNSNEFKNADLFGKLEIAWDTLIAQPFSEWWNSSGKAAFEEKGKEIGDLIVKGLKTGVSKIGEEVLEFASNHKVIATAVGIKIGTSFLSGISTAIKGGGSLVSDVKSLFNTVGKIFTDGSGSESTTVGKTIADTVSSKTITSATTTVNGTVVNVYGAAVNNSGGAASTAANTVKGLLTTGGAAAIGTTATAAGGGAVKGLLTTTAGSAGGSVVKGLLPGEVSEAASAAGHTVWANVGGGTEVALGTTSSGLVAGLANVGLGMGSGASTVGGAAAVGGASIAGIIAGIAGLVSAGVDVFQGYQKSKAGDSKGAKDEYITAGTKAGMVATGAGVGAAVGSVVPVVGTAVGAAVGAGIGGVGALLAGDKVGKGISDSTDEGGFLSNAWGSITETAGGAKESVQEAWGDLSGWFDENVWTPISDAGVSAINVAVGGWELSKELISEAWGDLSDWFSTNVWEPVKTAASTAGDWIGEKWASAKETLSTAWGVVSDWFSTTVWEPVKTAAGTAGEWIGQKFDEAKETLSTAWDVVSDWFSTTVWEPVKEGATTVGTWIGDKFDEAKSTVQSGWSAVSGWFESNVWGPIKSGASTVASTVSSIWDNVKGLLGALGEAGSQATGLKTSTGSSSIFSTGGSSSGSASGPVKPSAWGGIMNAPYVGMVAEDGPEAIIPLSPSKSERGFDLWKKAGEYLGVKAFADGGITGDTDNITPIVPTEGGGDTKIDVNVAVQPEFVINGENLDKEEIIALIKAYAVEMTDDIADKLADKLKLIFDNMPRKGIA